MGVAMAVIARDALIQRLTDAFEDAGLYRPDRDMVEGIYGDAVEPLRRQLAGAVDLTDADRRFIERILLRSTAGPDRRYAETIVAKLTTDREQ
jgi:hypothetical protein